MASDAPKFDAEVAKAYAHLSQQHKHDRGPWNMMVKAVEEALPKGGKVLDLASGCGDPGIQIATELPHCHVTITDVSQPQITLAIGRTAGMANTECKVACISDLLEFADNSFDVVTCCYGYMFVDDKQKAINETCRVLKPGGTLVATYWRTLPLQPIVMNVVAMVSGQPPAPPPINPLALAEAGVVEGYLSTAKLTLASLVESTYPFELGADRDMAYKMGTIMIKSWLDELRAKGDAEGVANAEREWWAQVKSLGYEKESGSVTVHDNTFALVVATKLAN